MHFAKTYSMLASFVEQFGVVVSVIEDAVPLEVEEIDYVLLLSRDRVRAYHAKQCFCRL